MASAAVELQHNLNTQIKSSEPCAEEKTSDDVMISKVFEPRSLDINLGNPMENIKIKNEYNYRFVYFFILALSLSMTGNLSFFTDSHIFRILVIVYNVIIIILCLVLFYVVYSSNSGQKNVRGIDRIFHCFNEKLNIVKMQNNIYELYIASTGFFVWLFTLNAAINTSMREIFYHLGDATECGLKSDETKRFRSQCAANNSVNYVTYIVVYAAWLLAIGFVTRSKEILDITEKEKHKIVNKYKHTNIKIVDDKVAKNLNEKWQRLQLVKERKMELISYIALCMVYHIAVYAISRNTLFSGNIELGAIIFALYMNIIDSFLAAYIFFIVYTLVIHYSFPSIIMNALAAPIDAMNVDYLISWWELRQYYRFCVVNVYGSTVNTVILYFLLASIVFNILVITTYKTWNDELVYSFLAAGVYCVTLSFLIVAPAVKYYKSQLSHSVTINKERLKMKRYSLVKQNENIYSETTQEIMCIIDEDIKNDSKAIVVIGINIDAHFMLFLRATSISFAIAVFVEVIL